MLYCRRKGIGRRRAVPKLLERENRRLKHNRKNRIIIAIALALIMTAFGLPACSSGDEGATEPQTDGAATIEEETSDAAATDEAPAADATGDAENKGETEIKLMIDNTPVDVAWEDNESVKALAELCADEPLKIEMSMYGGFEQVGSIGTSLPRDDVQTSTSAGDIVLYSGNQIVVFYGTNSWAYTRLGKITNMSADELANMLGNQDVVLTLSV